MLFVTLSGSQPGRGASLMRGAFGFEITEWPSFTGTLAVVRWVSRNPHLASLFTLRINTNVGQINGGLLTSMQALLAADAGDHRRAGEKITKVLQMDRDSGYQHFHHAAYLIASAYAVMNQRASAVEYLRLAADEGFPCYPLFEHDPGLNNLRKDPKFIEFMARQKKQWEHFRATL